MSNYPMFYEHSVPADIGDLEWIANSFGISVTDVDIWDLAKHHEKPPHLGNIYLQILFSRLQRKLSKAYPNLKVDYFINGTDTLFCINAEKIYSQKQFDELINTQL